MRTYRFAQAAAVALERQIDFLLEMRSVEATLKLQRRIQVVIADTLCSYPHIGTYFPIATSTRRGFPGRITCSGTR